MSEFVCTNGNNGMCDKRPFKTDDRTKIEGHISAKHLNYFPYVCGICDEEGRELTAPTLMNLQLHTRKCHPDQTQKVICLLLFFIS